MFEYDDHQRKGNIMLEKKCSEFINELGTSAPVPGGGSASALVGAIGIALGTMVGELTTGKKNYEQYEAEVSNLIYRSKELTEEFQAAVNADVQAFEPLASAFKMPKASPEEKAAREEAIQAGLAAAADAPLHLAELCVKALRVLDSYSLVGNKLAISDAGTGAALCEAALKGAKLNVMVNVNMMKDPEVKKSYKNRIDALVDTGIHLAEITYARVEKSI